jgi:hypothetical protein
MEISPLVGLIGFLFILMLLLGLDAFFGKDAARHARRRREPPPPGVQGRLRLFDADGKPFLSARLSAGGLQKLLDDYQAGRLG